MRKFLPPIFAILLAFFMVAIPSLYYRSYSIAFRNFRVVEPGVLYRGGQMTVPRLERVVATHGIRTIVCLRGETDAVDKDEEAWAKANHLHFVRMAPLPWVADANGVIPAEVNARTFQNVMKDPKNHPVLVHCFAGVQQLSTDPIVSPSRSVTLGQSFAISRQPSFSIRIFDSGMSCAKAIAGVAK